MQEDVRAPPREASYWKWKLEEPSSPRAPPASTTSVEQARVPSIFTNTQEPFLVQQGPFPLVAVIEHHDKTYMHLTQDPSQF